MTYQDVPRIGARQLDWLEWAVDPQTDYWTHADTTGPDGEPWSTERNGRTFEMDDLPEVVGRTLRLAHCPVEIVEDLLYRIEDQAPDMVEQEAEWGPNGSGRADLRALKTLAARIRKGAK